MRRAVVGFCVGALTLAACSNDETVTAFGAADRLWRLTELDQKTFDASATLTFPEAGTIVGNAPCNSFSATIEAPYPWFSLGPITSTRRACPDLSAETAFLRALSEMTLVEVLADTLLLSTPDGRSMVFKADG